MSVSIQTRYPVSAGARGLLGARWRYDTVVKPSHNKNLTAALNQAEYNLKHSPAADDRHVGGIMYAVGEKFRIDQEDLFNAFYKKFNCSPLIFCINYKKSREGKPVQI